MIKVVKGNVVLRVKDDMLDFYVNKGYTAKTLDGQIIKEAVPNDMSSLRKAYADAKKEIEILKAEIAKLKTQPAPKQEVVETAIADTRPKRTRKKSIDEE